MDYNLLIMFGTILTFLMFIYSGFNKIKNFETKIQTLINKTNWNIFFAQISMLLVIILEIFGSFGTIYLIYEILYPSQNNKITLENKKKLLTFSFSSFILFIILATIIYHPPSVNKIIPFLSNLTLIGNFIVIYSLFMLQLIM